MYRPHLTKSVASSVFRSLSVFSISAESSAFQKGNLKNTVSSIHKKTATIHLFGKFDHSQQLLKPAEDNYHLRMEKYDKCVFIFAFLGKDFNIDLHPCIGVASSSSRWPWMRCWTFLLTSFVLGSSNRPHSSNSSISQLHIF